MRVALLADRFDPSRGGGEGYVVSLARGLVRLGHDVHVFSGDRKTDESGATFHPVSLLSHPPWAKALSMAVAARRISRQMDFDLLQGFGCVPWVDVLNPGGGAELGWLRGEIRSQSRTIPKAWLALRRTVSLKLLVNLLLERMAFGKEALPLVVVNSRMVERDLMRHHRMDPKRLHVIYHGVDLERFHPAVDDHSFGEDLEFRGSGKGPVLLFMAHNFRLKGLEPLLAALGGLRDLQLDWRLVVVGRGRRGPYEELTSVQRIRDKVSFVGPQEEPQRWYRRCDLLVHPCYYDAFGLVCLEAMACGVPVLTSRCAGAHELITQGVDGWVVDDPGDVRSLQDALHHLMTGCDLRGMGQMARLKAEGFGLDEHIAALLSVYHEAWQTKCGQSR